MSFNKELFYLAERVRSKAASVINNETSVVQPDEHRIAECMDIINLCNQLIIGPRFKCDKCVKESDV